MIALQKLWKMFFISSKKLFSFSRYSNFCNFFPYFPHCRFKRTNGSGIYWFWKKKYSKLFQGFLIVLFQNFLFLKEFIACNGYFGLFTKIKKGSGNSICCTFSAWFFHKNVTYLIFYLWTKFQSHTFFTPQDIKHNALSSSYLDNWWRHKL